MKQVIFTLLIALSACLLCSSCRHRKSAEEGEIFLKEAYKRGRGFLLHPITPLNLVEAEQEYDFTPTQLVRLKQFQLDECTDFNNELARKLMTDIDNLAEKSGNDSLLCAVRWDIIRIHQTRNDTTAALQVLQKQLPLVRRLYGEKGLIRYYHSIAMIYKYYSLHKQRLYWIHRARPLEERLMNSWYNTISEAYLQAGDYEATLLYADSALITNPEGRHGNQTAEKVKGIALVRLLRPEEAFRWYISEVQNIENFKQRGNYSGYAFNQQYIFLQYATLLYDTGHFHEAIDQLQKITSASFRKRTVTNLEDVRDLTITAIRLMANCYNRLNQQEEFRQYTQRADSLQILVNKEWETISRQKTGEGMQNNFLRIQLEQQLQEMTNARYSQYILAGIVCILLVVITAGIIAWRRRQKRLRQLFEVLAGRHALWLEQHQVALFLPLHEVPMPETISIPVTDETVQTYYRPTYLRVLQVMQEEKPFLDPELDLVGLSRSVGTNRTMLSTVLNRETGMSFSTWLAEYRVNYLLEQLPLHTGKPITELYPQAGFSSRTSFFRQFRQVTGMTPSQYQALQKSASGQSGPF